MTPRSFSQTGMMLNAAETPTFDATAYAALDTAELTAFVGE